MTGAVLKEPIEWTLDEIEAAPSSLPISDPNFASKLPTFYAASAARMHILLMAAVRRPDAVRKRPALWEECKDILAGIRSGELPKPLWWDKATEPRGDE